MLKCENLFSVRLIHACHVGFSALVYILIFCVIQTHCVPLWDCEVNLMVLKLKGDFLLEAGGHVEHSLPMVSDSIVLVVLVCTGEELLIAFNHSVLISSHSL